jgi:hypothetical protein
MFLAAVVVLSLAGCSSVDITTDYDRSMDFATLKTYDWMSTSASAVTANQQAAMFQTSIVNKNIKNAVNEQLKTKGLSQDTANPDFYIVSHLGTQEKVNVTNYGYGYGRWGAYGGGGVDVQQYTQGTLILDFISAKTKELVWRGVASGALAQNPSPEQAQQKINDVVQAMLTEYPPAKSN